MSKPEDYGKRYFCVKTDLSADGEIYITGNIVQVNDHGDIAIMGGNSNTILLLAISSGHWTAIYGASVLDGRPVAVDHWKGEITEGNE